MKNKKIERCTFCNKEFNNFKTSIELKTRTERLTVQHTWEKIGNLDIQNRELLCEDCFNKFLTAFKIAVNDNISSTENNNIIEEETKEDV